METSPPPTPAPEIPWKISGRIAPAPIGPLYKLGAALNALAMLLLPGLYLGMVGGLGWIIYSQMQGDASTPEQSGSSDEYGACGIFSS